MMNIVLHDALAPKGIFVGSVLVSGVITPGDERYDPALIAKQYWKMYEEGTHSRSCIDACENGRPFRGSLGEFPERLSPLWRDVWHIRFHTAPDTPTVRGA